MPKKIVAIGGDGVGPEVINAACSVLESMSLELETIKPFPKEMGGPVTPEAREACESSDAILFGAAGEPENRSIMWIVYLRWELDNYANVRPIKYYEGARSAIKDPSGIDFVIVRENSEGMYSLSEGDLSMLAQAMSDFTNRVGKKFADFGEGKFAVRIISRRGCERIAKKAYEIAKERKTKGFPGRVTIVTKSNILPKSDGLFQRICEETAKEHPELACEHYYVDDMARRILRYPKDQDVIVTPNLYGDILSDAASELVGGLGVVPSGCVGDKYAYFEPVHGTAPKYAGKQMVNPTAAILSAKMALEYIGMTKAAENLDKAVAAVYEEGKHLTYDQGGKATTMELAQAVAKKYDEIA